MKVIVWTGAEVYALRKALLETQPQFSERTTASVEAISKWERAGTDWEVSDYYAARLDPLLDHLDERGEDRFRIKLVEAKTRQRSGRKRTQPTAVGNLTAVAIRLPELRRALDRFDLPEDGPPRQLDELRVATEVAVTNRLESHYARLILDLPELLGHLSRARAAHPATVQRDQIDRLTIQALRAADAIADKHGHFDLSARVIEMMRTVAADIGDPLITAATAYVRTEIFFANGDLPAGLKLLDREADLVEPGMSADAAATYGSLHMRAAIAAAATGQAGAASEHLDEAAQISKHLADGVYLGTVFGPSSVRIHRVSLAVELGEAGEALAAAGDWRPPSIMPAERQSHFYVDVARAHILAGQYDQAREALTIAESVAPQHTNSHPQVREMLTQLAC